MHVAESRLSLLLNVYGVLLLAVIIMGGVIAVHMPAAAIGGSLLVTGGIAALVLMRRSNVLTSAMLSYALLLVFPAFLPRPTEGREGPAYGGALDTRAIAQLLIFASIIVIGSWLWLVIGAGISDLLHFPLIIMWGYALLIGISLAYTPQIAWPAYGLFKLTSLLVLLTLLWIVVKTSSDLKRAIDYVLYALTVLLGVYWFDILRGAAVQSGGRYRADWIHPNQITLLAVALLLVLVVRFLGSTQPGGRAMVIPWMGFAGISALMGASKSSLGAAAVALLVATIVIIVKKPTGSMLARIMALSIGLLGLINYFLVNNIGIAAHLTLYEENTSDPASLTGRVPVWNTAISNTIDSPISTIFGHGYLSTFSLGLQGEFWLARQAHNSFIQTFFDLGLVGVFLISILYISSWIFGWRGVRRYSIFDPRWVRALELLTLLTAFSVVSLTEDILGGTVENHTMLFLFIVFCIHKNHSVTLGDDEVLDASQMTEKKAAAPRTRTQAYLDHVTGNDAARATRYQGKHHAHPSSS